MKRIILALGFSIAFISITKAQEIPDRERRWLIGVSLTPIFQGIPAAGAPTIGTQIKYAFGKHAIRLYTSYSNHASEKDTSFIDNATGFVFAPGYQYTVEDGKFKFFFGGDIYIEALSTINKNGGIYAKTETGHTGIKFFMGASYQLSARLSISAELGKLIAGETKKLYASEKGTPTELKGSYSNFVGGQILMLNYHF